MARSNCPNERLLANALSAYVDLMANGTAPSIDRFLEAHSSLADDLRPLLEMCVYIADAVSDMVPTFDCETAFQDVRRRLLSCHV